MPRVQVSLKLEYKPRELVVVRQDDIGILRYARNKAGGKAASERGNETATHPSLYPQIGQKPQKNV